MASFEIDTRERIARVRLTRPAAANALDREFWSSFAPALDAIDRAGDTRALIVTADGPHFCAGLDLSVLSSVAVAETDTAAARESFRHLVRSMQAVLTTIERLRFPVLAAVQGACIGAGLELLAACDLRFASADAQFRIEEINLGMMADLGSLQRLPKSMPDAVVREMALLGTTLTAERAATAGFLSGVFDTRDDAIEAAEAAAERIATRAPLAIAGSKAALRHARDHSVDEGLEWAALMQASLWNRRDIEASMKARADGANAEVSPLAPLRGLTDPDGVS